MSRLPEVDRRPGQIAAMRYLARNRPSRYGLRWRDGYLCLHEVYYAPLGLLYPMPLFKMDMGPGVHLSPLPDMVTTA